MNNCLEEGNNWIKKLLRTCLTSYGIHLLQQARSCVSFCKTSTLCGIKCYLILCRFHGTQRMKNGSVCGWRDHWEGNHRPTPLSLTLDRRWNIRSKPLISPLTHGRENISYFFAQGLQLFENVNCSITYWCKRCEKDFVLFAYKACSMG